MQYAKYQTIAKIPVPVICRLWLPKEDYLNRVWRDFRKVVHFIEDHAKWLLPMLEQVSKNSRG